MSWLNILGYSRGRHVSVTLFSFSSASSLGPITVTKRASRMIASCLLCLSPVGLGMLSTDVSEIRAQDEATASAGVSGLIDSLKDNDSAKRWKAARDLGRMGPEARVAVPALLTAMKDPNHIVRYHTIIALGDLGDDSPAVVKELINAVGDEDPNVRIAAANSVSELVNDPDVLVPMVVAIIEKEHPLFASRMIETIVMRGEKALPFLVAALKNERAAYWACLAIEELGKTAAPAVPALIDLLKSKPNDDLKVQALLALAKIGTEATAAQQQVLALLEPSSSDSVLTSAAFAAGSIGFDEATKQLQKTVNSDEPLLALVSRWALAKLHPEDASIQKAALDQLISSLGSDDATVRLAAAEGLQSLSVEPDVLGPKLIEMLNDSDPVVAHNLVDALASLGEPVAERAGQALSKAEVRVLAVRVLERLGPQAKSAVPNIVDAMESAEGEFRRKLQNVLGQIGPDASQGTAELIRSLNDDSEDVRISALLALGRIGPGAGAAGPNVEALMVRTEDPFEKLLAAWTIAKINASDDQMVAKIVPVLIDGLRFPDGRVQAEAASILGSLGPAAEKAVDELNALSNDESASTELRELAKEAVSAIR